MKPICFLFLSVTRINPCLKQQRYQKKLQMTHSTVQAIWDHKSLTELAWGVREGQNLPQNGLNVALEPSRGPQIGQWTLKWTQMVPPTARDWFESISWPFKALQPLYIKKTLIILYCQKYWFLKFQLWTIIMANWVTFWTVSKFSLVYHMMVY